jgi:predicted kinase
VSNYAERPNSPSQPSLVLVTGVQGTGKSTVAEAVADILGTTVLAHDWAMSALRPYAEIQTALDAVKPNGHRVVGWSIVTTLARSQLRQGRCIVLDGVARSPEIVQCREVAQQEGALLVVIMTKCTDRAVHRARVESRQRSIPNWYELDWDHVQVSLDAWEAPEDVDLILESTDPWESSMATLRSLLGSSRRP